MPWKETFMTVDIHFTWMKDRIFFTLDKGSTIYLLTVPLTGSKDLIIKSTVDVISIEFLLIV